MSELIKAARVFASSSHERISVHRSPALQSPEAHLKSVAQIVSSVSKDDKMIAAAWLHDIVEETAFTVGDVERKVGAEIAKLIDELTVAGPPERGNRIARLALAKEHFAKVSAAAKTVKLADLIDTCRDLYKNDSSSFRIYEAEANELASVLDGGDSRLLARLKRDLNKFASGTGPAASAAATPGDRLFKISIAALQVIAGAFTAQDIAEPLISFDSNNRASEILEAMTLAGAEVAGLHKDGILCGFVEAAGLSKASGEALGRKFASSQMIAAGSSFMGVIEVLTRHDWCFVTESATAVGAISRSDVQKPAVRMWLFGILTVAELEFTERIRRKWPDERVFSESRRDGDEDTSLWQGEGQSLQLKKLNTGTTCTWASNRQSGRNPDDQYRQLLLGYCRVAAEWAMDWRPHARNGNLGLVVGQ